MFLEPGELREVVIGPGQEKFSCYDTNRSCWTVEAGTYQIYAASSSRELRLSRELMLPGSSFPISLDMMSAESLRTAISQQTENSLNACFRDELPLTPDDGRITLNTTVKEIMASEKGKALLGGLVEGYSGRYSGDDDVSRMMLSMLHDMPLRSLAMFGAVKIETLEEMVGPRESEGHSGFGDSCPPVPGKAMILPDRKQGRRLFNYRAWLKFTLYRTVKTIIIFISMFMIMDAGMSAGTKEGGCLCRQSVY